MSSILNHTATELLTNVLIPLVFNPLIVWLKEVKNVDVSMDEIKEFLDLPAPIGNTATPAIKSNSSAGVSIRSLPKVSVQKEHEICEGFNYKGTTRQTKCEIPCMQGTKFCRKHQAQANDDASANATTGGGSSTEKKKRSSGSKKAKADEPIEEPKKFDIKSLKVVDKEKHIYKDVQTNFCIYYNQEENESPLLVGIYEGSKIRKATSDEKTHATQQGYSLDEEYAKLKEIQPEKNQETTTASSSEVIEEDKQAEEPAPKAKRTRKVPPLAPSPPQTSTEKLEKAPAAKRQSKKAEKAPVAPTPPPQVEEEEEGTEEQEEEVPKEQEETNNDNALTLEINDDEEEKTNDNDEYRVQVTPAQERRGLPRLSATKSRNRTTPLSVTAKAH